MRLERRKIIFQLCIALKKVKRYLSSFKETHLFQILTSILYDKGQRIFPCWMQKQVLFTMSYLQQCTYPKVIISKLSFSWFIPSVLVALHMPHMKKKSLNNSDFFKMTATYGYLCTCSNKCKKNMHLTFVKLMILIGFQSLAIFQTRQK